MKRVLAILLTLSMLFVFSACGEEEVEKYCYSCGEGISKDVAFCEHCGASIANNGGKTESNIADVSSDLNSNNSTTSSATGNSKPAESSKPTVSSEPSHTHSYSKKVTAATCTKKGYTTYTCSCGNTYNDNYVDMLSHSYTKKVTAATCTEKGYTTYTCSCGHSYKDNYTDPSHSYSKYVCTKCGTVDKSHAYEYLIEWVKENGVTDGTDVAYRYYGDTLSFAINYSAQYDSLSVEEYGYVNGDFFYLGLYLDDWFYGVSLEETKLYGYLDPEQFTDTSPISYTEYNGASGSKYDFIELARIALAETVDWLGYTLDTEEIGITLFDLGFKSY